MCSSDLKNSVSPDEMCDDYGADTLRVYEMSMGPLEASRPWATKDVVGAHRFLRPDTVAELVARVLATPPDGHVHEVVLRPRG